jgi:hypothetical protein
VVQVTQLPTDAGPGGVAPAESFRYRVARRDNKLVITEVLPVTEANVEALGGEHATGERAVEYHAAEGDMCGRSLVGQ